MMAEQGSVDLDWLPACFTVLTKTNTHIAGFVSSQQELETVLECHKRATMTSFNIWSNDRKKKEKSPHRILWQVEDFSNNVPLIVTNRLIYSCQHGKGRNGKTSEELCTGEEHAYSGKRKRLQIQTTKKKNCPAKLFVRHVTSYNDFTVPEGASRAKKQMALDQLATSLKKQEKLNTSQMIHMSLPLKNAHENHHVSIESAFSRNIHPAVRNKIHEYVSLGITTVPFLKKVLKQYVKNELCTADVIPPQVHDQAYYPSSHSIQNHVHLALVAGKYSGLDQVNLEEKVSSWKLEDPDAHFFFRKCTEVEDDSVKKEQEADVCNNQSFEHDASLSGEKMETGLPFLPSSEETCDSENPEPDPTKQNTFLFVHQNKQQQRLLQRYGEMVLLDATYKTSKYALPLFLVVVRTNVGYKPVAEFICENETTEAISEALRILKKWNMEWKPKYFMVDYCEPELKALQLVFPQAQKYICAFHREQAWIRWTREGKNNLSPQERSELLGYLRSVATACSEEACAREVQKLRDSCLYKTNDSVRQYVERRWLSIQERWCRAFAPQGFSASVTTNNGIEAMNNSLKSFYLKLANTRTVSSLAETVVCDFVPEHLLSYAKLNYSYTSDYRAYSSYVPDFLRNRPKDFVKHCLKAIEAASWYGKEQMRDLGKGCFQIKSEQSAQWYCVDLGDDQRFPSCECPSFQLTFLPCKHLFAIFNNSEYTWTMLSSKYTNSPYVTLDVDAVLSETQNGQAENAVHEDTDFISLFSTKEHSIQKTHTRCFENNPSNACVNSAQQFLREKLKILQDVSYLCSDTKALNDAAAVVHSLADNLKSYIPKENSLPLISTTQETAKPKLRKLPKRHKKIQSQAKKTRFGDNYRCDKSADQPAAEKDCIEIHETRKSADQPGAEKDCTVILETVERTAPEAHHSELDKSIESLWTVKSAAVLMSKIGPFKLFSMDFARLAPHRELESEVINAYIHTLVSKHNKSHESKAYLIDSFAMTNLWQGSCNILRKWDPSLYGILLGVINDHHHWTLAVIYPSEKRSVFLDPLGESKTNVTKCLETTRAFMRSKGCNVSRWTCGTVPHPLQRDGTSCGVFVCKFAEGMLEGEHFPFVNTEDAVRKIRKEIAVKLLQESEDLSDVCRFCGETTSHHAGETDLPFKWIACDGCDKWFHQSCVGNPPEEEEFFCQLCKH